jgi:hypothetical protein
MLKQFFRVRLAHPQHTFVELLILAGAIYNFAVTARWQGWSSPDLTVKYGAFIWALLIDGGYFACLFMMRDSLYKGQKQRYRHWQWGALLFGVITFHNTLLFNAAAWHPDAPPGNLGLIGSLLRWLVDSGTELVIKAVVPVIALFPLAMVPPLQRQSVEEVRAEADVEVAREEGRNRIEAEKRKRKHSLLDRYLERREASQQRLEAEQSLLLRLRAELTRAGERRVERWSDTRVKIEAATRNIYDPVTGETREYQPRPVPPFKQVLDIAMAHGLVDQEELEESQYFSGEALADWQGEVRQRVEKAGLTPQAPAASPAAVGEAPAELEQDEQPPAEPAYQETSSLPEAVSNRSALPKQARYSMADVARYAGLKYSTVQSRARLGYRGPDAWKLDCHRTRGGGVWFDYDQLIAAIDKAERERAAKAGAEPASTTQRSSPLPVDQPDAASVEQNHHAVEVHQDELVAVTTAN